MARRGKSLAILGGIGGSVGLICCLTPLLPILLGGAGLTGVLSLVYQDSVLLPFAAVSFVVMAIGIWMMRRSS